MTDQPGPNDPQQPESSGPPAPPPPPPPPPAAPDPGAGAASTPPPPAPPSYGTPPPAPGYGQMPPPGYAQPADTTPYANWGSRVVGALIDYFVPGLIAAFFYRVNTALGLLLELAVLGWAIYNKVLEGQTGQSTGKRIAGTKLISMTTGQPVGVGLAIGRYFVHILDAIPCYIGFLWPLWDAKRQTFADKILSTVVVKV
jgi:uncharacterized RDD family membrane protein YckC